VDSLRASLVARVPALAGVLPEGTPPTTLRLAPQFDDALSWDLIALGAEWLVPGLRGLARNRVRLLEVNPTFVGALMVGANTEIARELVWRGYPVDERATFFHRFWEYADDAERRDVGDIALDWARRGSLAANVGIETVPMTAIVVRGDLVRRYPTAHWFLQAFDDAGEPVDGDVVEPSFLARLDAQTAALGFDRSSDEVRAGYFVGVEEQPAAPRFGLDAERPGDFGRRPRGSWDTASWGHVVSSQEELDALTYARASGQRLEGVRLEGATWGRNAAHQARATWQRPVRMLIRPELLI
jgi:hypothetical protein